MPTSKNTIYLFKCGLTRTGTFVHMAKYWPNPVLYYK